MACIFCGIIDGSEQAARVHEDDLCIAFMDVHPLARGHTLLIPKRHVEQLEALPAEERQHLYGMLDRLVDAQRSAGYGREGTHFIVNDGKAASQHVPHAHIHLVPRQRGDSLSFGLRMLLHFSGLFGFRTGHARLEFHAQAIREALPSQPPA